MSVKIFDHPVDMDRFEDLSRHFAKTWAIENNEAAFLRYLMDMYESMHGMRAPVARRPFE